MVEELNLKELVSVFIRFAIRNIRILMSFMIISSALVLLYYILIRPPHYVSLAICTSHITNFEGKKESQRPAVDLINYLQDLIDRKDFNILAELLGVEDEVANKFIKINAVQLDQMDLNEEYILIDKFTIKIVVSSNKFFNEIQDGFLYYFNTNKYLIDLSTTYFEGKKRLYNDIVAEIKSLQEQKASNVSGDFVNTEVTNSLAVNEIVHLSSVREGITKELKYKAINYVQPFSSANIPSHDILLWIILTTFLSFICGLVISLIREIIIAE